MSLLDRIQANVDDREALANEIMALPQTAFTREWCSTMQEGLESDQRNLNRFRDTVASMQPDRKRPRDEVDIDALPDEIDIDADDDEEFLIPTRKPSAKSTKAIRSLRARQPTGSDADEDENWLDWRVRPKATVVNRDAVIAASVQPIPAVSPWEESQQESDVLQLPVRRL